MSAGGQESMEDVLLVLNVFHKVPTLRDASLWSPDWLIDRRIC